MDKRTTQTGPDTPAAEGIRTGVSGQADVPAAEGIRTGVSGQADAPAEGLLAGLPPKPPAPSARPAKRRARRVIILLAALLLLGAGGLGAYRVWLAPAEEETAAAPREYTVGIGDIRISYEADGTVWLPYAYLDASYSAEVLAVNIKTGDRFQAGDILAVLDDTPLQETLEAKQDALDAARETLQNAEAGIVDAQSNLAAAKRSLAKQQLSYRESIISAEDQQQAAAQSLRAQQQAVADAQVQWNDAQKQLSIMEQLSDEYAQSEFDAQRQTIASLENKLQTEQETLQTLQKTAAREDTSVQNAALQLADAQDSADKAQLTVTRAYETRDAAQKNVEKAQQEAEEAALALQDAQIIAPCDGFAAAVNFGAGDTVSKPATPSGTASFIVYRKDGEPYTATAAIPELDIQQIYEGQTAELLIDAWGEDVLTGTVTAIANLAGTGANNVITYTVEVAFDTAETGIRDQMNASLTFITKDVPGVIQVNNDALFFENGSVCVTVKGQDGQTETRAVTTGFSDGSVTEIVQGLSPGEIILSRTLTTAGSTASAENARTDTGMLPGLGGGGMGGFAPPMGGGGLGGGPG